MTVDSERRNATDVALVSTRATLSIRFDETQRQGRTSCFYGAFLSSLTVCLPNSSSKKAKASSEKTGTVS